MPADLQYRIVHEDGGVRALEELLEEPPSTEWSRSNCQLEPVFYSASQTNVSQSVISFFADWHDRMVSKRAVSYACMYLTHGGPRGPSSYPEVGRVRAQGLKVECSVVSEPVFCSFLPFRSLILLRIFLFVKYGNFSLSHSHSLIVIAERELISHSSIFFPPEPPT